MTIEEQFAKQRERAVEAARRFTIDKIVSAQISVKRDCRVVPGSHIWEPGMRDDRAKDYIVANAPDLLELAIYAWYQLQRDGGVAP